MSDSFGRCTQCEHVWIPRKSPAELDQPRCSECGATGSAVRFVAKADVFEAMQRATAEPAIIREAKQKRRWEALRQRLEEFLVRVEGTAPADVEHTAAREVREPYWEANQLLQSVTARGPEISLETLQATADRVETLEDEIEEHAPELDAMEELFFRLEELINFHEALKPRVAELKSEEYAVADRLRDLEQQYNSYQAWLETVEEDRSTYEQGAEDGMALVEETLQSQFVVSVPCAGCGGPVPIQPRSELHSAAIEALRDLGYTHPECGH